MFAGYVYIGSMMEISELFMSKAPKGLHFVQKIKKFFFLSFIFCNFSSVLEYFRRLKSTLWTKIYKKAI